MSISVFFFDLGDTLVTSSRTWLPGAKELVAFLKHSGERVGIISNTRGIANRQAILNLLPSDFEIGAFEPKLILFSSEVGIDKPHRQIFEMAINAAGVPGTDCLYCSEDAVETLVAQAAGMRSLRLASGSTDLSNLISFLTAFQAIL